MILLYLSIPVMVLAVAIATVPLLAAMRREEGARRARLLVASARPSGRAAPEEHRRAA